MKAILFTLLLLPAALAGQAFGVTFENGIASNKEIEGICGPLRYAVRRGDESLHWLSRIEIRNSKGRMLLNRDIDNQFLSGDCGHDPIRGVRTLEFYFAFGGSGAGVDWMLYRVNPFRHLLSVNLWTHSDFVEWIEEHDLNGDGQKEVIIRDGSLSSTLCESCDYDADTVEYLLCYADGGYHECAKEFPDYFHGLIEKGFKQLTRQSERNHRLAWSLFILFHAAQLGESEAVWTRLEAALPPEFLKKVTGRRYRVAKAISQRDRNWKSR